MHEYSIIQALLAQVGNEARTRGATAVRRVEISIGDLAGVETDLLKTAFDQFRQRTICDTAELVLKRIGATWACRVCGREKKRQSHLRCESCERPFDLVRGDEIMLDKIDMEVPDV